MTDMSFEMASIAGELERLRQMLEKGMTERRPNAYVDEVFSAHDTLYAHETLACGFVKVKVYRVVYREYALALIARYQGWTEDPEYDEPEFEGEALWDRFMPSHDAQRQALALFDDCRERVLQALRTPTPPDDDDGDDIPF